MKVGDLVESAETWIWPLPTQESRTNGIVIRAPLHAHVLIFWPGEGPVWEHRRSLVLLQEAA